MKVVFFAVIIVLVVALGWPLGWIWWPYVVWPATGIALVFALFCDTPRGAGLGAALVTFAIWTAVVVFFVIAISQNNSDGTQEIADPIVGTLVAIQVILLVGVPLALGSGLIAALGSFAGRRTMVSP